MTDSKWTPADVILTSTNASNGSGNPNVFSYRACKQDYMKLIFKELCNSINLLCCFVKFYCSKVPITGQLLCVAFLQHVLLVRELGLEPRMTESKSVVLPLHHSRTTWRKTEESNPIRFLGTEFSRLVGRPSHLHHLPTWYPYSDSNRENFSF